MSLFEAVPRRCVNLPPGRLRTLLACTVKGSVVDGMAIDSFYAAFADWLGTSHVLGASSGRTAFLLALKALELAPGAEILFPRFTFPVMPLVAKMLGYQPVFCEVDPHSFNSAPEHFEAKLSERTGAILATHLFGRPCAIVDIVEMARQNGVRVLEDCAHACGVRVSGQQVGTFGDIGIFSFAEGKNMPCYGGGAIATADDDLYRRAYELMDQARVPDRREVLKKALSIWGKWLLTRPSVFGTTVYPILRLKDALGRSLMDSAVGDELLDSVSSTEPSLERFTNLQASIGLQQLKHIDTFNQGARRNARILTETLGRIAGMEVPEPANDEHIYVYYPLRLGPDRRDQLRSYLLRHGIDSKVTDMADCSELAPFRVQPGTDPDETGTMESSILEICVYPVLSDYWMYRIAEVIQDWSRIGSI